MRTNSIHTALLALTLASALPAATISEKTVGTRKINGLFPLYWDDRSGKMWMEIPKLDTEYLYVTSLPAGLGSNDVGLDRAKLGGEFVVRFERSGPKVLMAQPNYRFRAISSNPAERRAVEDAFARAVHWGFRVEAEEGDRVLVDATDFFLRDAFGVAQALQRARQGQFRLDPSRSAFYLPRTKGFAKNTEVETTLTFLSDQPGAFVASVAASAGAVTVREHHSFVELPGPGFTPRPFDPRAGYFGNGFMDYATPINEPIMKRFISRHRLQKKDPRAAVSEPVKPIIYYLDPGTPEPIRSALLEGARWWNQAFESAGYKDAFRVEMLPEDADPMDVRYNVINWVHRSTRGWSYGSSVSDPRTGEIIKGHVTLGSLRVRQDFLIAEGILAPYETGKPAPPDMERMALARLRQLSAHEVGHTLGLSHNYVASASNRASVMDYPHPWIDLPDEGAPALDNAYAVGIGEWDKVAITWGYQDFPPGTDAKKALDKILSDAMAKGLIFLTDQDARPEGSAHPRNHLWDSGANAVDELDRLLRVRRRALSRFGERNIREGAPWATLEDVLVPTYLLHRYQTEAAAKVLGGLDYTYALRGDGQMITRMVSGEEQRRALGVLLKTISPETLELSPQQLAILPPRAPGYPRTREDFRSRTGLTFDPLGAAEAAANLTLGMIFQPERAARLIEYSAREASLPGLAEVIDQVLNATWKAQARKGLQAEIARTVNYVTLYHLMALAHNERNAPQVRAVANLKLDQLARYLAGRAVSNAAQEAQDKFAIAQIKRFQENPKEIPIPAPVDPPPGQPIGCEDPN